MSIWSKVYPLEGITDFYADDDFEEAIQVASDNTDDLSVKLRITVEPASEPTIAALHARIAELEAGLERSKKIMETIYTISSKAGIRTKQIECPHGIIPSFPSHAWWCDKCFEELQNTIWELEDLQKAQS